MFIINFFIEFFINIGKKVNCPIVKLIVLMITQFD